MHEIAISCVKISVPFRFGLTKVDPRKNESTRLRKRNRPSTCICISKIVRSHCEGGVDVVGVVTSLRGGAQVVLHGDQVVELSVLLGVHQEEEVEEDGEGQVEVEREEVEVKERRSCVAVG